MNQILQPESIKVSQRTSANKTYDVYYYYDGFANFVQLKKPSDGNQQIVKNFFYDGLGRVVSEQNPYFDAFSTSLTTPSTTVNITNYTYDTLGRVIFVRNPDGTNKTINFNHRIITAYDENGHRKSYILDDYNRITNVLEYNNDPVLKLSFETDIYNTSYQYDTSDNLIKITDTLGNIHSFTYDSLGRRINLIDPDLGNWTYTYDLAGNLVTQRQIGGGNLVTGDGYYREYDSLNQLIRIRNGSTITSPQIENYTYDPFGQRIKIMRNDSAHTVIYTPFKEFMQIRNSSGVYNYTYIYQDGILVARVNPDGSKYYYHPDQLGSTSLITDQNGNVVENTFYSPFGETLGGGSADVKLYTGQMKDFPCQYYYGARYFAPCMGIFTQPDNYQSVFNPQGLNRYSYALNNPYVYRDTTGKSPTLVTAGIGAIAGAVIDFGFQLWQNNGDFSKINYAHVAGSAVGGAIFGLTLGVGSAALAGLGVTSQAGSTILAGAFLAGPTGGIASRTATNFLEVTAPVLAPTAGGRPTENVFGLKETFTDVLSGGIGAGAGYGLSKILPPISYEFKYATSVQTSSFESLSASLYTEPSFVASTNVLNIMANKFTSGIAKKVVSDYTTNIFNDFEKQNSQPNICGGYTPTKSYFGSTVSNPFSSALGGFR